MSLPHSRISPTAKFAAHIRSLVPGLLWAGSIAEAVNAEETFRQFVGPKYQEIPWLPALIEARYLAVNRVLKKLEIPNILEIGSGLSPRGLNLSGGPTCTAYVETDLPGILNVKRKLARKLLAPSHRLKKRLFFQAASFLKRSQLERAAALLPLGPIAVVSEAVLPYLTHAEKRIAFANIRSLLFKLGGFFVTPDIRTRAEHDEMKKANPELRRIIRIISGDTGRNLRQNAFANEAAADRLFAQVHLRVEKHRLSDFVRLHDLASVANDSRIDPSLVRRMLERKCLWIFRP